MAKHILDFLCSNQIKHREELHSLISLFVFVSTVNLVFSQTSVTDCILNIQLSSSLNSSNCEATNWGGFINNSNCCSVVFDDYLYALGRLANQTGQIYLNFTEQNKCLNSMKSSDQNIWDCGIDKLTSGVGGCFDYVITDVITKLGNNMKNLGEGCKLSDLDGTSSQACSDCLRGWKEIGAATESTKLEADICRFTILVTLTSKRIDDERWVHAVYNCLGGQDLSKGEVV